MVDFSISIQTKLCRLLLCSVLFTQMLYLATGGVCENGPSKARFEYWKGDDESVKGKTTPQALIFENVMIRGNIVLMCDVSRALAREVLCTYNRGCQRTPELAFPGLRIANEKEGWIEGDDSFIYGEEKGCIAHYSSPNVQKECNLDPATFGTTSQCQTLSITTPINLLTAPSKFSSLAGVTRLNGTTLRHVIRGSNVGLWWQEDFFHFYRLLTPSSGVVVTDSKRDSSVANFNSSSASSSNGTWAMAPGGTNSTTTQSLPPKSSQGRNSASESTTRSSSGVFSLKEAALSAFRSKNRFRMGEKDNRAAFIPSALPSHILLDSIIDYRNWSETAMMRYESFFSESRGAAEGIPNKRDMDGMGFSGGKHGAGGVDKALVDMGVHNYIRQNKEWARSLVYCAVLQPFQLAQPTTNLGGLVNTTTMAMSRRTLHNGSVASAAATTISQGESPPAASGTNHWVRMQDPKTAYSLNRLVIQPFDRCVYHGKIEPTQAFEERRKRFSNLRADVHDCVAVNKSAVGSVVLLYGRSDLKNRRWTNVFDLASRIQSTPGVRLPIKVVERIPHTFREQVQLFSSAAMLITVHGAALVNVPFMPYSSTIVELVRLSKGETSLIRTFGLDAAVSSHIIIDLKAPSNDLVLSFNLLRQKLCDKNDLRKQASGKATQKQYSDAALAFADMNLFCRNVTSSSTASTLKGFASGLISAIGS